jgi:hypothetical protein
MYAPVHVSGGIDRVTRSCRRTPAAQTVGTAEQLSCDAARRGAATATTIAIMAAATARNDPHTTGAPSRRRRGGGCRVVNAAGPVAASDGPRASGVRSG